MPDRPDFPGQALLQVADSVSGVSMRSSAKQWGASELLAQCLKRPADELAWQEFTRRFHRAIEFTVVRVLKRAEGKGLRREGGFDNLVDGLVGAVYLRLVENRCAVLKRFKDSPGASLDNYIVMLSVKIARQHLRTGGPY